ncbi:roadblock/LC7 domain-containing protein [Kitasatospora aureofaciens]|uniref:roadblock/LC7 domain-containing protein n=1 Tax=Kitasatospora aureofaciens TaxID=1894 RepID=UPI000525A499|nr:roadblock/LC7 domain-containing protein [Kitasatospora aureofaciens]
MNHAAKPDLSWLLNDITEVADVSYAVVATTDGLVHTAAGRIDQDGADRAAANLSAVMSVAKQAAGIDGDAANRVRQCVLEFDNGWLYGMAAGANTVLGVRAGRGVDPSVLAHRMAGVASRVREHLSVDLRSTTAGSVPQ